MSSFKKKKKSEEGVYSIIKRRLDNDCEVEYNEVGIASESFPRELTNN